MVVDSGQERLRNDAGAGDASAGADFGSRDGAFDGATSGQDAAAIDAAPGSDAGGVPDFGGFDSPVPTDAFTTADAARDASAGADSRPLDAPPPSDAAADAGSASDAGRADAPFMSGFVSCAGQQCSLASSVCCHEDPGGETCIDKAAAPGCAGAVWSCDQRDDCLSPQVCCARLDSGNTPSTACSTSAACSGSGVFPLCQGGGDCPAGRPFCCPAYVGTIPLRVCSAVGC